MPRWVPAPRIPDDVNDPLYVQFLGIPATGTGTNLSSHQLCILFRRSPAERHARASEVFGPPYKNTSGGLIKAKWANPTRTLISSITDQDLQALGMTRAQIPRFATGGANRPSASIVEAESSTGFFDVVWHPRMDSEKLRLYLKGLDIDEMPNFGTLTSPKTGTMEVKPMSLTYSSFVLKVFEAVSNMPASQELPNDCRLRINQIQLLYCPDEEGEDTAVTTVDIHPISRMRNHSTMDAVKGVLTQLPVDNYMVFVGLDLEG